jgi:DnaJ-class molecular chaperone
LKLARKCPNCEGTGYIKAFPPYWPEGHKCLTCKGTGKYYDE